MWEESSEWEVESVDGGRIREHSRGVGAVGEAGTVDFGGIAAGDGDGSSGSASGDSGAGEGGGGGQGCAVSDMHASHKGRVPHPVRT